jgi:glycosyltransferase involved in cell wall biosynthesis
MKLTIITINYNNAEGLRKSMESVLNQTSKDFEYIIIDNQSTDGSLEVIQTFELSNFHTFKSISEPDSGIYNAMNKGIRMAKGDYIHFLNSGDWLIDELVVEKMLSFIENQESRTKNQDSRAKSQEPRTKNQESRAKNLETESFSPTSGELVWACDILVGDVISIREDGKKRYDKNSKSVSLYTFYRGTIQHTSAYIRRTLFEEYGLYDESLKIVSDWKWYLNAVVLHGATVRFADMFVTCFDRTGISSTQLDLDQAERRKVLEELIPAPILADYDRYSFDIEQMERIRKHRWLYSIFWFVERVYFKLDKWNAKYWSWKKQ